MGSGGEQKTRSPSEHDIAMRHHYKLLTLLPTLVTITGTYHAHHKFVESKEVRRTTNNYVISTQTQTPCSLYKAFKKASLISMHLMVSL